MAEPSTAGRGAAPGPSGGDLAGLALVLGAGLLVRLTFIAVTPPDVHSADVNNWRGVVFALERGFNPYQATTFLNWPPFWMQILFALSRVAQALGLSLFQAVRAFLLVAEGVAAALTWLLVARTAPAAPRRVPFLVGWALNPIALLLTCQHCNFDLLVGIWVLLFLLAQVAFQAGGDAIDWLASCLWLGLGVLTKTVPLVLTPMLMVGLRRVRWKGRLLGLLLLLGPVTLGMSILYALAPAGVERNVLGYRSAQGWFGITGLLGVARLPALALAYARLSPLLFAAALLALGRALWRPEALTARQLVLLALLLLMAVVAFGPGYGPQYVFWFLPLLVASYPLFEGRWRQALIGFYAVAALTYVLEYALFPSHGMLVLRLGAGGEWARRAGEWSTQEMQTWVRLPLFLASLALFALGATTLRRSMATDVRSPPAAGL